MNRRERRAARNGLYAKAEWYAVTHDFRQSLRNMRTMVQAIERRRNPLCGEYRYCDERRGTMVFG